MMDENPDISRFGSIAVEAQETVNIAPTKDQTLIASIYTWRPPGHLDLPPDFTIAFKCLAATHGLRSFAPVGGLQAYIYSAYRAGLEIIRYVEELTKAQYETYIGMRLLFDRLRRMHEHRDRQIDSARDLFVRPRGRISGESSLLPADVGLDSANHGTRWSIARLTREGHDAALREGVVRPTYRDKIHYGLAAAARRRPLTIPIEDVPALMKLALFDSLDWGKAPDAKLVDLVYGRMVGAVAGQPHDGTSGWYASFMPGKGNLIKTLAGGKRTPGGKLSTDDVKRVLWHTGWYSYEYVANCLDAFAHFFWRALPIPLSPQEESRYAHMYRKQACYGELPLALLMERGRFLRTIVMQLWDQPEDQELIGTLHRLLSWYAEIADARRDADRRFKSKVDNVRGAKVEISGQDVLLQLNAIATAPGRSDLSLEDVMAELVTLREMKCPNCLGDWQVSLAGQPEIETPEFLIEIRCQCGMTQTTLTTTKEELQEVAKRLQGEEGAGDL